MESKGLIEMEGVDLEIKRNRIERMDVESPLYVNTEIVEENDNGTRLKLQISYNLDITDKSPRQVQNVLKRFSKVLRELR